MRLARLVRALLDGGELVDGRIEASVALVHRIQPRIVESKQRSGDAGAAQHTHDRTNGCRRLVLVFVRRVDEHHSGDVGGIHGGIVADKQAAKRMARDHQRALYASPLEKRVKIAGHARSRPRRWARRTPSVSRAIVRAYAGDRAERRLYVLPRHGAQPESRVQDYCGCSLSGAMDVKNPPADVDRLAGWCVTTVGHIADDALIDRSGDEQDDDQRDRANDDAVDHAQHTSCARWTRTWGGHCAEHA